MTHLVWALAALGVAALAWDAARRYVASVVATREHAAKEIAGVHAYAKGVAEALREAMGREQEARAKLETSQADLLAQVKRLHARLPESPIIPKRGG